MKFNVHRIKFSMKCENRHFGFVAALFFPMCLFCFPLSLSRSLLHFPLLYYCLSRRSAMEQMYRLQIPHHLLPATQAPANQHFHAYAKYFSREVLAVVGMLSCWFSRDIQAHSYLFYYSLRWYRQRFRISPREFDVPFFGIIGV